MISHILQFWLDWKITTSRTSNILNFSFDFTELPSPQLWYGEPSPSQRRRLAKSMTNLRQLVEFKGALQSVPKNASENPLKCFSQSTKALHQKHCFFLFVWGDSDIARQKNETEPKDVVKNWMRQKNTLDYLGLWEKLHNSNFKGVEFDPLFLKCRNYK